jgi:hypothetical protein
MVEGAQYVPHLSFTGGEQCQEREHQHSWYHDSRVIGIGISTGTGIGIGIGIDIGIDIGIRIDIRSLATGWRSCRASKI